MSDNEKTFQLELEYDDIPGSDGIFDGVELARQLINDAYKLLIPYTNHCPGCADNMFTAVANEVLETIHREAKEKNDFNGLVLYTVKDEQGQKQAMENHLQRHKDRTEKLLKVGQGFLEEEPDHIH